jgi:autotransporter-associated beta strand protein
MERRALAWVVAAVLAAATGQAGAGVLSVTSAADSGPGSLRDALSRAHPGDRVVLAPSGEGGQAGTSQNTAKIVLAAPLPPIAAPLVLELRAAAPDVAISGGALVLEETGGLSFEIAPGRAMTLDVPITGVEGDRGLAVAGGGSLILMQPCNYRGETAVTEAALKLGGAGSLPPKERLTLMGGRFELGPSDAVLGSLAGDGGTIELGARTLTIDQDVDSNFQGAIEGAGRFVKAGAGRLVLGSGIGWTGGTEVNGGVLELAGSGPTAQIRGPITLKGGMLITSGVRLGSGSGPGQRPAR